MMCSTSQQSIFLSYEHEKNKNGLIKYGKGSFIPGFN